jgi:DNA-binding CsgD family transcriptional regulator
VAKFSADRLDVSVDATPDFATPNFAPRRRRAAHPADAADDLARLAEYFDEIDGLLALIGAGERDRRRAGAQKAMRDHLRATAALAAVAFGDAATARHGKHRIHALIADFGGAATAIRAAIAPQFDHADLFPRAAPLADPAGLQDLTPREREVLEHLMKGGSNKIIAYRMGISDTTVKSHVTRILRKLGVHSRMRAVAVVRAQM